MLVGQFSPHDIRRVDVDFDEERRCAGRLDIMADIEAIVRKRNGGPRGLHLLAQPRRQQEMPLG